MRHFLQETDFSVTEAQEIFRLAKTLKAERGQHDRPLSGQSWGVLLYKNSTRTRVSFEVGIQELGAHPIILNSQSTQIGRGETVEDSSRVLSRYLHGLIIRTFEHEIVESYARNSSLPVINGLTDFNHPCQLYTALFTLLEHYDPEEFDVQSLRGKRVAFFGDTQCNMANSWILSAAMFGLDLVLCGPESYAPKPEVDQALEAAGLEKSYKFTSDPKSAAEDTDVFYTDVWISMGDSENVENKKAQMLPYQVTTELMNQGRDPIFMHCLPAHAGEEVSQEVLDSPQSTIFDEAENRLHVQKAIMTTLARAAETANN